jgi:sugar phosphate isomerase/epimerase
VGFRGIGLQSDDLEVVSAKLGYPAMKRILDDTGIGHVEIEIISGWFANGARKQASDRAWAIMLEAAEKLGAYYIKAYGDPEGGEWPDDHMVEAFRILCADAANAGTRVALEMMPFTDIRTRERCLRIVEGAGADNGGLCIDVWHTSRCDASNAEIARIPKNGSRRPKSPTPARQRSAHCWRTRPSIASCPGRAISTSVASSQHARPRASTAITGSRFYRRFTECCR